MQKARIIFEKPAAQIIMSLVVALLSLPALPINAQAEEASLPPLTLSAEAVRNEGLRVVPVTQGTLAHSVPAMARVLPDTTRTVTLHTAGDGKVLSVLVLPGQNVKTGQPLVTYQNHTLHLARLQAAQTRAALAAARADQANASAAYDRARALAGTTVSVGEMRRRLAVLKETQNAVATHEAELGVLAHRLQEEYTSPTEKHGEDETSTIISPVDGTVTQVETAVAADVAPPQPLLTVSDTAHVWIVSDVPPQDAQMLVSGGRQETFLPPAGDAPSSPAVQSTIETIETAADPATGLVRVLSRVANPAGHLRPGMMLNSLLQTTQTGTGLLVPAQAIQNIGGQTVVFVQTAPEHFQPTPVRTGMEENDTTLVLSGLKQGDQVVSDGSLALKAMVILPGMDAD